MKKFFATIALAATLVATPVFAVEEKFKCTESSHKEAVYMTTSSEKVVTELTKAQVINFLVSGPENEDIKIKIFQSFRISDCLLRLAENKGFQMDIFLKRKDPADLQKAKMLLVEMRIYNNSAVIVTQTVADLFKQADALK